MQYGTDIIDYTFGLNQKIHFKPGQYMEWTLPHTHADNRGNRRYLTIASSPTEDTLRLGVKFYQNGSSFKRTLAALDTNTPLVGAQLTGDFTLPDDPNQKCVFIAGGIGITPFRSMIKYLLDTKQARPIILLYANKTPGEIIYTDVFEEAQRQLGIKTIYTLTDKASIPAGWKGKVGRIDETMIRNEVPDFMTRVFYLSGPHAMVHAYQKMLAGMRVPKKHVIVDYFPGF